MTAKGCVAQGTQPFLSAAGIRLRRFLLRQASALLILPGLAAPSVAQPGPPMRRVTAAELATLASPATALYTLGDDARTVLLDFPTLRHQGLAMARIVLFIEREGAPRDAVMTQDEVARYLHAHRARSETLTYGNNFRAAELARFFNAARSQREALTGDEQWLLNAMLAAGILRAGANGLAAAQPERVVLSIPQVSDIAGCPACTVSAAMRAVILEHELSHARFALDEDYRSRVLRLWDGMEEDMRQRFTRFLHRRGYDTGNAALLANEMQAFLLYTPDPAMFNAKALGASDAQLQALRRRLQDD